MKYIYIHIYIYIYDVYVLARSPDRHTLPNDRVPPVPPRPPAPQNLALASYLQHLGDSLAFVRYLLHLRATTSSLDPV